MGKFGEAGLAMTHCVFCVVYCAMCVCVVVQCVGVGVCFGMVLVLVCHVDPSLPRPPVPTTPLFRVHIPVCVPGPRPQVLPHACRYTRHVLNLHNGGFQPPHRTHTPRPQTTKNTHKTQHQPPQQHSETGTERNILLPWYHLTGRSESE